MFFMCPCACDSVPQALNTSCFLLSMPLIAVIIRTTMHVVAEPFAANCFKIYSPLKKISSACALSEIYYHSWDLDLE